AIGGVVAGDELVEVSALERPGLEREVHIGAQVVDPERLGPRRLAGGLAVEEENVGLDALGVEDAGGHEAHRGQTYTINVLNNAISLFDINSEQLPVRQNRWLGVCARRVKT